MDTEKDSNLYDDSMMKTGAAPPSKKEEDAFLRDSENFPTFQNTFARIEGDENESDSELESLSEKVVLLGKYHLEKQIGAGGMGVVWKAYDSVGERSVALKFVPKGIRHQEEAMRQVKEAFKTIQSLNHQYICPVYALERSSQYGYFIVMKWLEGETLDKIQHRIASANGCVNPKYVPVLLKNIAEGLDYAHSRGVIHRDVKPTNICLKLRDDIHFEDAFLIDFGLAASIHESVTRYSTVSEARSTSGTRPYMPPEQWRGRRQDGKTDVYALGVVAYELYAGRLPFSGGDTEMLRLCILQDPPENLDFLSPQINAALQKALAKKQEDRFSTCTAFIAALDAAPESESTHSLKDVQNSFAVSGGGFEINTDFCAGNGSSLEVPSLFPPFEISADKASEFVRKELENPPALYPGVSTIGRVEEVPFAFHWCPAGSFFMGSPPNELGRSWRENQRRKTFSEGFWISETPITQMQWNVLMQQNPSGFRGNLRPVENVSWFQTVDFCKKLSEKWDVCVKLPTEAQWEYACRAGTASGLNDGTDLTNRFSCRNLKKLGWAGQNENELVAFTGAFTFWFSAWALLITYGFVLAETEGFFLCFFITLITSFFFGLFMGVVGELAGWVAQLLGIHWIRRIHKNIGWKIIRLFKWWGVTHGTHEAAQKLPNQWGLYDMHGNVYEWCEDKFEENDARNVRGGCWFSDAAACRSASRMAYSPQTKDRTIGFRILIEI